MQEIRIVSRVMLLILGVMFSVSISAQGTVKGFVNSESTGEAVMFVSVSLEGTSYGVTTDISGYYSLSEVPAGIYNLVVSSIEYENVKEKIEIKDNKVLTKNFSLKEGVIELGSAEVNADKEEQLTSVRMSVETIRPADLKKIPSFGGQADLVQALQVMPGFVSTGDQGGSYTFVEVRLFRIRYYLTE